MDALTIELKKGAEAFKEIYFRDGRQSFLRWRGTRNLLLITTFFLCSSLLFYFLANKYAESALIFLMIVTTFITFISSFYLWRAANKYFTWKKEVDSYLTKIAKYDRQVLILTQDCFELTNSDETSIDKWESINHVSIESDYLTMTGKDAKTFMFPKKTMEPSEFEFLTSYVRQRMNNSTEVTVINKQE
jgi:hypothetical protein